MMFNTSGSLSASAQLSSVFAVASMTLSHFALPLLLQANRKRKMSKSAVNYYARFTALAAKRACGPIGKYVHAYAHSVLLHMQTRTYLWHELYTPILM